MLNRWKKKKFVPKREREAELSIFWICIAPKKRNIKWVKVQKKGSKCNSVAMVTDNLNWWLNAIKLSTLFLHLTFAVRIKLHLAARAAIVYDFSSLPNSFKKKKQITNGPPISNKSFKASSLACFNDIISPAKTKSFQSSIQEFYELFLSTRLMR